MLGFAPVSDVPLSSAPQVAGGAVAGGMFRRALWSWLRVFRRRSWLRRVVGRSRPSWARTFQRRHHWLRVVSRSRPSWTRIWRWKVSTTLEPSVLTKPASEDRDYGFDFSKSPELVGGLTISSAAISGGTGLTFGSPTVNAAAFDGIAIGYAVTVRISGGTAGETYDFALTATLSNGRVLVIPARLTVVSDYE